MIWRRDKSFFRDDSGDVKQDRLSHSLSFFWEKIRPVQRVEQRILEAEKLGFSTIFVSKYNKLSLKNTSIKVQLISKIEDLVNLLV